MQHFLHTSVPEYPRRDQNVNFDKISFFPLISIKNWGEILQRGIKLLTFFQGARRNDEFENIYKARRKPDQINIMESIKRDDNPASMIHSRLIVSVGGKYIDCKCW